MNNIILQQLIHGYQSDEWLDALALPVHWNHKKGILPLEQQLKYFKDVSKEIQQAMKFYIDARDTKNNLSPVEMEKVVEDLKIYLPYKSCLIQLETENCIYHVLVGNDGEKTADTEQDVLSALMFYYQKRGAPYLSMSDNITWAHDYCTYGFTYHHKEELSPYLNRVVGKEDYTFWLKNFPDGFILTDPDSNDAYTNPSLNDWTSHISMVIVQLNVLLAYPEITDSKDVLGRPNNTVGHTQLKNLKDSTLRNRPKYQHKTLKLNMYGEPSGGESKGKRSEGTAFHSVRKHIRKLASGKKTFVKAHFRGSKDIGVVTKDYEVKVD
tara:strand:- start:3663 stop:4634 length:972 start_codon:yes stop_codon:yes gene_type:complete